MRPTSLVTEHDDALHVAVRIRDLQLDTGESLVLCQEIIVSELNPWSGTSIRGLTFEDLHSPQNEVAERE